ncbi:unnamed protein product [Orchesella dallaii]|uniref:N-acetyltransferase domain-containing protein n=1 Tax=Orchesella dallaii TaxID=48710 RepID=A0ABP1QEI0_9HEXA
MSILPASFDDIPKIVTLVQNCYRGDSARKGWTHEADLLDGTRLTPRLLKDDMSKSGAVVLKYIDDNGEVIGCVYTEKQNDKMYTGMLCVSPHIQASGLGKKLMNAVDNLAREQNCCAIKMHVISRRTELVEWYERRGFRKTGDTAPFPTGDDDFGKPKIPLEFVVMQKDI